MIKKKLKISLCIAISLFFIVAAVFLVFLILKKDNYTSKYVLVDCDVSVAERNNAVNTVRFEKKYESESFCLYFDTDGIDKKSIDITIDNFTKFKNIFDEKNVDDFPNNIYVSNDLVFNEWNSETLHFSTPNASVEESLAWLLYFHYNKLTKSAKDEMNLPFGLYAGISSYWLQLSEYDEFIPSNIENSGYLTELQFPLYEQNNLPLRERNYVWSFSTYIIKSMLSAGKTETEILSSDKNVLESWLEENLHVTLPDYSFEPYSKQYEYKIKQGCFTYYVNKEYNDLIIPRNIFSTSYDILSDWLKDNEKTTKESNDLFRINNMYNIDVYLDDGLKSPGISGYAYDSYINIYSVGSFSHEYIHHILFFLDKNGNAREVIPEMHANTSKYSRAMWYYLFTGQAENFPYDQKLKEKELYSEALTLYSIYDANTPSADNFNFWLFADCFSAIHTKKGTPFIHRLQTDSLAYYIARVYGAEYVWKINSDTEISIDGKPYSEIVEEWYLYINLLAVAGKSGGEFLG